MSACISTAGTANSASCRWIHGASCILMLTQAILLGISTTRNSVTFDEVVHLPAGISYWETGEFWCYHHNPPLVRLLFAWPAILLGVPMDYTHFHYIPGSRGPDVQLGEDFLIRNHQNYLQIFAMCRMVVVALTVWGGRLVFRWSQELFGDFAGLLGQFLWTFCPNVLAHGSLVTPDMGASVFGFLATYHFWRYLRNPTWQGAAMAGLLLGVAEASKFTFVILPLIWLVLLAMRLGILSGLPPVKKRLAELATDGFLLCCLSLMVLNVVYLYDGTGTPLGKLSLVSRSFTGPGNSESGNERQVNRFRGTASGKLPIPFPEQYILGFDAQLRDQEGDNLNVLRCELRRGHGWWYYYLYCLAVKTPLGTLGVTAVAICAWLRRIRDPNSWLGDATLLVPIGVILAAVSASDGINSHLRYVLPIFPFGMVFLGGAATMFLAARWRQILLTLLLAVNVVSVGRVHPWYLTYFHELAGGPTNGYAHLADSNVDWGQGLVALREWLERNAPGRRIQLAYFGGLNPESLGFEYDVPGSLPPAERRKGDPIVDDGPSPGLHVISAIYLAGMEFAPTDGRGGRRMIPQQGYVFYRDLQPHAIVGNCLFVYDLTADDVNRLRRRVGLAEWNAAASSLRDADD